MGNKTRNAFIAFTLIIGILFLYEPQVEAQTYNALALEDRPVDYQPPFPDEEFSFSRFNTQSEFNEYLRYRFPIGTPKQEIDRILVGFGNGEAEIITNDYLEKQNLTLVRYSKYTWKDFLYSLAFMPQTSSFANFYFNNDDQLIKSFAVSPNLKN